MNDLIRFHDAKSAAAFLPHVRHAFPQADVPAARLIAVDWNGRQYLTLDESDDPMVYRADLGFGEFAELAERSVFDAALSNNADEVLERPLFERFREQTGALPSGLAPTDCVEFTRPLYLGGADDVSNMAVIDLDVHWTLGSQIYAQVRDLPPGTPIGNITISD
jgi:hypothetical protein